MAFVEMGPVSNSLIGMVTKRFKSRKVEPLFARTRAEGQSQAPAVDNTPIRTAPLNRAEMAEQDTMRALRDAIHSAPRD